jgi:hypothetical protein
MDPLTQWFHITNKFIKKDSDKVPTHLLLNGGCIDLSEDFDKFMELYPKHVRDNKLYIIEKKTPVFNFFLDLDFIDQQIVDIREITTIIQQVINFFYEQNFHCIVCTCENKNINKQSNVYIKQGFHLHWPKLKVNISTAKQIRISIVTKLQTIYGKRESCYNSWNDIVDECVLDKNGLRMCYSSKGHFADGKFVSEGRPYSPAFVVSGAGGENIEEYNLLMKSIEYTVRECSIRTNDPITPVKNIPIGLTEECEECEETNSDRRKLSSKSQEYQEIIRFFKCHVKDYTSDDIKGIFNYSDGKLYIIQTRSQYCQNIGKEHNSCGVYFKLTSFGLCQKCFCKCDTMSGRKYGYCKDFSSSLIPCSDHLKRLLKWKIGSKESQKEIQKELSVTSFRDLLYNQFTNKSPLRDKRSTKRLSNNKKDTK